MEFKSTIFKSVTAILCVIALCITASVTTGKLFDAKLEAAKTAATATGGEAVGGDVAEDPSTDVSGDPSTDAPADTPADEPTTDTPTEPGATDAPANTDAPAANSGATATDSTPKTVAEITAYYNNAVNKAVSAKVGFNKTRVTDNENMDASAIFKPFKSLVYKFMGIGADNKYSTSVTKGKWGEDVIFKNANLSASDVTKASCTKSGDNYVITMSLKNGSSTAGKDNPTTAPNSALDKTGISVGSEDKGYYDHKTASVIYDAIASTFEKAEVKENYSGATVKTTINAKTGNIVSIVIEWNVNVIIAVGSANANATGVCHVNYTGFKY